MIFLNNEASTFQKLQVVAVPRESFGKFYDGDAYIIPVQRPIPARLEQWENAGK